MPSAVVTTVQADLDAAIDRIEPDARQRTNRREMLARSFELRSGRERPGRFWKVDLEALDLSGLNVGPADPPRICGVDNPAVTVHATAAPWAGIAIDAAATKFGALTAALQNTGAYVHVPADIAIDQPIEITYAANAALFSYTLIVVERGARCTVVERFDGTAGSFVCGITEIVTADNAHVIYAADQRLPAGARFLHTRAAAPGKDATVELAVAELGGALSVTSVDIPIRNTGVHAQVAGIFFPRGDQHVDMITNIDHATGDSRSETIVKSAATDRGQARYLGNIRIAPQAQGSDASLRDDALLLSTKAHIDSVPALEIAANDVKAYHGATVGAIDDDQIFYMTSRGIERSAAEQMIALGFFEPALERFPTRALRERLREALEAKIRS